jgi:hypothetical protein
LAGALFHLVPGCLCSDPFQGSFTYLAAKAFSPTALLLPSRADT